ncbi:MAG: homospermidine synthase [Rhodocyclaceae bacterium]|nr:homospermidine synthase [Rhodocyclaceae bacterium]
MVGFGCVGQGVLPLLLRHIDMKPEQVLIMTADEDGIGVARKHGVPHMVTPLTKENYRQLLEPRLSPGDFLLNLSVDVSSVALMELCQKIGALYLDTCIEPWAGGYTDPSLPASKRSNYALRETALALRKPGGDGPTAILTHGANPGLVSHFVKQALLNISADAGKPVEAPATREGWARLAQALGVRAIHVAERDSQVASKRKVPGEFVNTWSVDGFVGEGFQPAELGWGSHERHFPVDGYRHDFGSKAAIYLARPGASTQVRTWTPLAGPIHGFLITHSESISIADYFTVGAGDNPEYRPTVHYAYHPCDDAVLSVHELAGRNWRLQKKKRVLKDEIVSGIDELGVLLMGHGRGIYWYGSQLSISEARSLAPHNSATSLQVTAPVMAGVIWAMKNPACGLVEPEGLPYEHILRICRPYLGNVVGAYGDWTPLKDRGQLFEEALDLEDPWQFKNFRVV